ncbi:unnamed protein product, partial [Urochloa humidicola]
PRLPLPPSARPVCGPLALAPPVPSPLRATLGPSRRRRSSRANLSADRTPLNVRMVLQRARPQAPGGRRPRGASSCLGPPPSDIAVAVEVEGL